MEKKKYIFEGKLFEEGKRYLKIYNFCRKMMFVLAICSVILFIVNLIITWNDLSSLASNIIVSIIWLIPLMELILAMYLKGFLDGKAFEAIDALAEELRRNIDLAIKGEEDE